MTSSATDGLFLERAVDTARVDEFAGLYRDELTAGNDPFPPVRCVEDRDGRLVLYDGWHRLAARRRIAGEYPGRGYDEIAVDVLPAGERHATDLAYELAIDCSALGSKQLTQRERIAAAKRLSELRPDVAAREIARRLGISHATVLQARGTMAVTGGGSREPLGGVTETGVGDVTRPPSAARRLTLEQLAWRAANALRELLDQSREETRGMLGFGKPNVARAGVAAY